MTFKCLFSIDPLAVVEAGDALHEDTPEYNPNKPLIHPCAPLIHPGTPLIYP
jgi:hypothetical protein